MGFLPKGARSESAVILSTSSRETSPTHTHSHKYRPFIVVVNQLNYQMLMPFAPSLRQHLCLLSVCVRVGILLLKCMWVFNFSTLMGGVKYWNQCE